MTFKKDFTKCKTKKKLDGISFVSPCHAGCTIEAYHKNECTCIEGESDLEDGLCNSDCPVWRFWVFVLIAVVAIGKYALLHFPNKK